jgi:hypothetical protein
LKTAELEDISGISAQPRENLLENKHQLATEKIQINFVPHLQRCIEVVLKFSRDKERSRIQEKNTNACMSRSVESKFARALRKRKRKRETRGGSSPRESLAMTIALAKSFFSFFI